LGGARVTVDEPPDEVVQKIRAGYGSEAEGWLLLHDHGFDLWINTIEVAALLHDDDPRAQVARPYGDAKRAILSAEIAAQPMISAD
jgi:hypothetical protein